MLQEGCYYRHRLWAEQDCMLMSTTWSYQKTNTHTHKSVLKVTGDLLDCPEDPENLTAHMSHCWFYETKLIKGNGT